MDSLRAQARWSGDGDLPHYLHKEWLAMLKMLAWRDAPVELSRRVADQQVPPVIYRGRLFEVLPNGGIIVERSTQITRDRAFGPGDDIELLLMHHQERLIATCTIKETVIRQVNTGVRIACFRLSPGRRPQREQRRSFYRVSVAAMAFEPVELIDPDPESKLAEPIQCKLVNLSGGGVGVSLRTNRKTLLKIKRIPRFTCKIRFGEPHGGVNADARVAHVSEFNDDGLYLGLEFDIQDPTEQRIVEDKMVALCAEFQRLQLQRRRA